MHKFIIITGFIKENSPYFSLEVFKVSNKNYHNIDNWPGVRTRDLLIFRLFPNVLRPVTTYDCDRSFPFSNFFSPLHLLETFFTCGNGSSTEKNVTGYQTEGLVPQEMILFMYKK
jgi:hypothetical protein